MRSLKQTALKPKKAGVQQCPIAWVGMWKIHQAVLAQEFFSWGTKFMLHVFHLHVSCMTYLKPTLWVNRRLNPSLQKGCSVRLEVSPVLSMATQKKVCFFFLNAAWGAIAWVLRRALMWRYHSKWKLPMAGWLGLTKTKKECGELFFVGTPNNFGVWNVHLSLWNNMK